MTSRRMNRQRGGDEHMSSELSECLTKLLPLIKTEDDLKMVLSSLKNIKFDDKTSTVPDNKVNEVSSNDPKDTKDSNDTTDPKMEGGGKKKKASKKSSKKPVKKASKKASKKSSKKTVKKSSKKVQKKK